MGQIGSLDNEFMGMRDEQRTRQRDVLQRAETEAPSEPSFAERFVSGVTTRGGDFLSHLTRPGFLSQTLGPLMTPTMPDPQKRELEGFLRVGDFGLNLIALLGEQAGEGANKLLELLDPFVNENEEDQAVWKALKKGIQTVVEFGVGGVTGAGAKVASKVASKAVIAP